MALTAINLKNKCYLIGGFTYRERKCLSSVSMLGAKTHERESGCSLNRGRNFFCATEFDGRIVVAGGYNEPDTTLSSVECVDLRTHRVAEWSPLIQPVELATSTRFGNCLAIIGGLTSQGESKTRDSIQSYDLARHEAVLRTEHLNMSRFGHASILLPDGNVLIAGGQHVVRVPKTGGGTIAEYRPIASVELWNPVSKAVRTAGHLTVARDRPGLELLPNGKVLVIGGKSDSEILDSIELYDPTTLSSKVIGHLSCGRMAPMILADGDNGVLIAGGWVSQPRLGRAIEYLDFRTLQSHKVGQAIACRAEGAMVWLNREMFALVGGKDSFQGRNPHTYKFALTERFSFAR